MNDVNNYIRLNNSFDKSVIFRLGISGGFFSEYNNMLVCMLSLIHISGDLGVFSGGSDCVHTLFFAVAIPGLLLVAYTEQWCLQDIDMVPLDQVREKLEEEGDQQ